MKQQWRKHMNWRSATVHLQSAEQITALDSVALIKLGFTAAMLKSSVVAVDGEIIAKEKKKKPSGSL